jgi:hypothetical protein
MCRQDQAELDALGPRLRGGQNRGQIHVLSPELGSTCGRGPRTHHPKEREVVEKRSPKSRTFDIKATTAQFPADPEVPFGPFADYYEDGKVKRRADVYVFAYYAEEDLERYSSLDLSGWRFYVLSTPELERHFTTQDTVALSRIQRVTEEVEYGDLRTAVDAALDRAKLEDS